MATLIICPACGTRYETKAVFLPEGRKVRCAKCAHVWQAQPVGAPAPTVAAPAPAMKPPPAPQPSVTPRAAPPPPPPPPSPPAAPVNAAMRGFAGIPGVPLPQSEPGLTQAAVEAELAAQVARLNAEAMAETPPPMPEPGPEESGGGIFARLARKVVPAASAPVSDAGMDEGPMPNGGMGASGMVGASMGDASMGDTEMDIDPALAAQAFAEDKPERERPSVVIIGWLALALVVASILGTLVLAPSAVMSVLPGAARLYALFGMPVGSHGLAFQGVRYGWTSEGGQTVLEVQGDVVNLTSAPLGVPTVVIALRDEKGEEISDWTTEIGAEELGAGEHAAFLRQIPSPPSNVRSVKVHFAKAE